jgi:endonuclease III
LPGRKARESRAALEARARQIVQRLVETYPADHPARPRGTHRDPLDELIFTVLSQNTSDINRDRAWASMKRSFPRWADVVAAKPRQLEDSIRMGGLAKTKAPRIQTILREIADREGKISLTKLRRMSDADVGAYLGTLPGIGPKTIACVLAFSLERPVLPVDTHVHRIGARLGFYPPKTPEAKAQVVYEELVAPEDRIETHVSLIAHGRTTCTAQRPACERCVVADLCPSAGLFLRTRNPRPARSV